MYIVELPGYLFKRINKDYYNQIQLDKTICKYVREKVTGRLPPTRSHSLLNGRSTSTSTVPITPIPETPLQIIRPVKMSEYRIAVSLDQLQKIYPLLIALNIGFKLFQTTAKAQIIYKKYFVVEFKKMEHKKAF
jgi:hypothetical protein